MELDLNKAYEHYQSLVAQKRELESRIAMIERDHLDRYLVKKPADEPHDKQCQKIRYGDILGVACTCKINTVRMSQAIFDAGKAGDKIVRDSLGSFSRMEWERGSQYPLHK